MIRSIRASIATTTLSTAPILLVSDKLASSTDATGMRSAAKAAAVGPRSKAAANGTTAISRAEDRGIVGLLGLLMECRRTPWIGVVLEADRLG
jgi:hypothetical protein